MAGGSIAIRLGMKASGAGRLIGYFFMGMTSMGVSYLQGHRSPKDLAFAMLVGFSGAIASDAFLPTGMTSFKQASYFAPRTWSGVLFNPGPHALRIFLAAAVALFVVVGLKI